MSTPQINNPLHGITLEKALTRLYEHYGWDGLADRININCFKSDPSIKSSLKFLRKNLKLDWSDGSLLKQIILSRSANPSQP